MGYVECWDKGWYPYFDPLWATQVARDARVQVNPNSRTTALRIKDFTRINPPTFFVSQVEEDPQWSIEEVFKVLDSIGVYF